MKNVAAQTIRKDDNWITKQVFMKNIHTNFLKSPDTLSENGDDTFGQLTLQKEKSRSKDFFD